MMEKKNNNPEKEAKDREFNEMMMVKIWKIYLMILNTTIFRILTCSQPRGCTVSSQRRGN